jgi:hypothetical protein
VRPAPGRSKMPGARRSPSRNRQAVSGSPSFGSPTSRRWYSRRAGARPSGWPAAEPRQSWHSLRPVLQHSGQSRRFAPWHFGQEGCPPQPHRIRPAPRHSKQLSTPVSLQRRQPCMALAPGRGRAPCPRPAPLAVSLFSARRMPRDTPLERLLSQGWMGHGRLPDGVRGRALGPRAISPGRPEHPFRSRAERNAPSLNARGARMARREEGACQRAWNRRATTPAGMDRTLRWSTDFGTTTHLRPSSPASSPPRWL